MSQTINTNLSSMTAQRYSTKSQNDLQTAISRLSSGLRINSAKDDAAGLAISERFTSQIRGLNQAARNANDGISLAQTAEGALASVGSNLQRMRELAVQSANASNSASDRTALQAEVSQLISEIDRVGSQTQFNGLNLLDGTFTAQAFQVGANAGQTIAISGIGNARAAALGSSYSASRTGTAVTAALSAGDLSINGVAIGASAAGPAGATAGQSTDSAFAVAAAINAAQGTVTATANATAAAGGTTTAFDATNAGTFTINGVTTSTVTGTGAAAGNRTAVLNAINAISAATGVVATDDGTGIDLAAADGRNINVAVTQTAGTFTLAVAGLTGTATTRGTVSLSTTSTQGITVAGTTPANAGLTATTTASSQTGTALSLVDISTVAGANTALASIDAALTTVNGERAKLGAIQNRFQSTIQNLQTNSENLAASRSRIQDADFAAETAALSRAQVLQQAGTAMVAQANQLPQQVLALLR